MCRRSSSVCPSSCAGHPLQDHQPTHIVDEVLQSDLGSRPHRTDGANDPAAGRILLRTEHVLDPGADLALLPIGFDLCVRQRMVPRCTVMDAASEAALIKLCLGLSRALCRPRCKCETNSEYLPRACSERVAIEPLGNDAALARDAGDSEEREYYVRRRMDHLGEKMRRFQLL